MINQNYSQVQKWEQVTTLGILLKVIVVNWSSGTCVIKLRTSLTQSTIDDHPKLYQVDINGNR